MRVLLCVNSLRSEQIHGTTIRQRNPAVSLEEEMRKSYLDYAMSVIVGARCRMCATA